MFQPKRLAHGISNERLSIGPHQDRASFGDFVPDGPDGLGSDLLGRILERHYQSGCQRTGVDKLDASDGSAKWHRRPPESDSSNHRRQWKPAFGQ